MSHATEPVSAPPLLLTAQDLAAETGWPLQRIWFAARTGLLPSVRLGRRIFFRRDAVDEWMAKGGARAPR